MWPRDMLAISEEGIKLDYRKTNGVASQLESARGVEPLLFFLGNQVERMLGHPRENPMDGITPNFQQGTTNKKEVRPSLVMLE